MTRYTFIAKTTGTVSGYVDAKNKKQAMKLIKDQNWIDLSDEETCTYTEFEIIEEYEVEDE